MTTSPIPDVDLPRVAGSSPAVASQLAERDLSPDGTDLVLAGGPLAEDGAAAGTIATTRTPDGVTVVLAGEIDMDAGDETQAVLVALERLAQPIVVDTSAVTFMDSTGISFLTRCATLARRLGVTIDLPDPPAAVSFVLRVAGVDVLFAGNGVSAV